MGDTSIDAVVRLQRIVFLGLVTSVGFYGVVAFMMAKTPGGAAADPTLVYALAAAAAVETLTIPWLRKQLLPPEREANALDAGAPAIGPAAAAALARLHTGQIVSWVLCEAMAIFGLVLVILTRDLRFYYGFAALALVNFYLYRPTAERVAAVVRAA